MARFFLSYTGMSRRTNFLASCSIMLGALLLISAASVAKAQRTVAGTVSSAAGLSLGGAVIEIAGSDRTVTSNPTGRFAITAFPPGEQRIKIRAIGFVSSEVVVSDTTTQVSVILEALAVRLNEVIVAPGQLSVATDRVAPSIALTQKDIESLPRLGDDMYRALARLPGVATNELTSKFRLHNAPYEDLLVRLDGLELIEPFHLKDFDGSISLVDADAISMLTLSKGGFSTDFGNHLAGALDMRSRTGAGERDPSSITLSLSGIRVSSGGTFAGERGSWRASVRRGYLDFLLSLIDAADDLSPNYWDGLLSVRYQFTPAHSLSVHTLHGSDATHLADEGDPTLDSRYGNTYVWSNWVADWTPNLRSETVVSLGSLYWRRMGANAPGDQPFGVSDRRTMHDAGIRSDWSASLSDRHAIRWGGEVRRVSADYDYERIGLNRQSVLDTLARALEPEGTVTSAYASYRLRPIDRITGEVGARYDKYGYAPGSTITPRASVAAQLSAATTLRASVGDYAQAEGIHQLSVQDGDTTFHRPERATHYSIGAEHQVSARTMITVDVYDRREYRRRPRFINLTSYVESFPEANYDRVRLIAPSADARGIDVAIRSAWGNAVTWSASYSLAKATEHLRTADAPRAYEQRHTLYLDAAYAPSPKWQFGIGWQFHSGWPTTTPLYTLSPDGQSVGLSFPAYNDTRLPAYHRLDLRASRRFTMRNGTLIVYADIFNAYDRDNVQGYDYSLRLVNGQLITERFSNTALPLLPTLGVTWQF